MTSKTIFNALAVIAVAGIALAKLLPLGVKLAVVSTQVMRQADPWQAALLLGGFVGLALLLGSAFRIWRRQRVLKGIRTV